MRVLFVNRFYFPDHSATSQMLTDLAADLRGAGMDIAVITGRQLIDNPRAGLAKFERLDGIDVHRVWSTRFGRGNLVGRGIDYLSFYLGAAWRLARLCRRGDVVVANTDPPLISVVAGWVAKWRGALLVNWLHDLFPEIAQRLGVAFVDGAPGKRLGKWLGSMRDGSLRRAHLNVVLGTGMAEQLAALGISPDRIAVIHNWGDGEAIRPRPLEGHGLRKQWGVDEQFLIMYSGNMGYSHDFDTILDAANRLRERDDIAFLFIGDGVRRGYVEEQALRRGLGNVQFKAYQPRETLGQSLTAANVHLVSLLPQLEGLIVPSKFYAVAAAGRPIVFIGAEDGELARLIDHGQCGLCVAPGDGQALAEGIVFLADHPDVGQRQGLAARHLFEEGFDRRSATDAWRRALQAVIHER